MVKAQYQDAVQQAKAALDKKDGKGAITILRKAYDVQPGERELYETYLQALVSEKEFEEAEQIVQQQLKYTGPHPDVYLDLMEVYLAMGKEKKAKEVLEDLLPRINGDDILTQRLANRLQRLNRPNDAIKVYEQAIDVMRNPSLYAVPLSKLYAANDRFSDAVWLLMDGLNMYYDRTEDMEGLMLELIGEDAARRTEAKKAVLKKLNEQPNNQQYAEVLSWLYTQEGDWEGALMQIRALDLRNKENGGRLLQFAEKARQQQQYEIALKALDAVLEKGAQHPMMQNAESAKLYVGFESIQQTPPKDSQVVLRLIADYKQLLERQPEMYASGLSGQLAILLAQYAHRIPEAIAVLEKSIEQPATPRITAGRYKLQLGDYHILIGKVWDASLLYSQVDKTFREDMLGEEARFRNARLAYYRGDFEWAQTQLTVLKASTSELIANDALHLSVLITENITPDSNFTPLLRFAHADLLLFQNRYSEALTLYDSIATTYPDHPLQDDILMQKASLAIKHNNPADALKYYQKILDLYKDDVLADDALFKMAELYRTRLKQAEKARALYEQLLIDFGGSTYMQEARKRLSEMSL